MAPKKQQQQKMALGDFLADQSLGSWADEMETAPMPTTSFSSSRAGPGGAGGFGADRGSFGGGARPFAVREQLPLPTRPPFTAHLGNLSFDVTDADLHDFLSGCDVSSIRIVEDKMDRRPKGFGYVEFATLDGLKKALELNETQFQGRNIRISVADPPKDGGSTRELNDWTRKGPLPDLPNAGGSMRRGGGGMMERGGSFRGAPVEGDAKPRDFGNWERKGPLSPAEGRPAREPRAPREGGLEERRASPAWGEGAAARAGERSERGDRPPRPERVPTAADMDNKWRTKMKPDGPSPSASPDVSTPTSPSIPSAPAQRPRLNLAKRTVSEAPTEANASSDSKASPFGAARPIDTSAREKEIEEKRQLAIRQRKEQDDKAREEKRAKEASTKEASTKVGAEKDAAKEDKKEKEEAAPGKQYEILRRAGEDEEADPEAVDADAEGTIVDDKQVKPQEITREVPKGGDSWRKSSEPQTTAEGMEEEGWSTVSAKPKNSRRGGNRALAS